MTQADDITKKIEQMNFKSSAALRQRILEDASQAMEQTIDASASKPSIGRLIMTSRITKYASAAIIMIGIFIGMNMLNGTPAWALEQTIEAMKEYNGAYLTGVCPGQTGSLVGFELWVRADETHTSTKNILVITDDGIARWTQDNSTYTYIPAQNTVFFENAVTTGFSHFFGSEFFELLSNLNNASTKYGYDPATGRKYAMLSGSITDVTGSKYLETEFDVETKLVTRIKQWENLPEPTVTLNATEIRYFKELPDSTFEVNIPAGAAYVEMPFSIPEANLKILSDPKYGISAEGLTKDQAARAILEQLYDALIVGDLERIRNLAPVTAAWTDEFLKKALDIGTDNATVKVLEIGPISKETASPLGPVVIMLVTTQHKDGTVWQASTIIQFRNINGQSSCVVHGPYGLPVQLQ